MQRQVQAQVQVQLQMQVLAQALVQRQKEQAVWVLEPVPWASVWDVIWCVLQNKP